MTDKELQARIEALEATEQRYHELFDKMRDGVGFTDMEGYFLDCNRQYLDMLGYESLEELQSLSYQDLTPPEYHEFEARIIKEELMPTGYAEYEKEYFCKDGRRIRVALQTSISYSQGGEPIGLWAIVRDVTEQRKVEDLLTRLKSLIDNASDFISASDLEGHILYTNPAGMRLVGREDEDPTSLMITDYHSSEWGQIIAEQYLPVVMEQGIWSGELALLHKDGTEIPISSVIMLIKDDAGQTLGFGAIYRDITAHQKREQRLQVENEILSTLSRSEALNQGDLEAAFAEITEAAVNVFEIARASLWLYNEDKTKIECVDLYEGDKQLHSSGAELSAQDYPRYFEALKRDRYIAADDAHTHPETSEFSEEYLAPLGINSMLDAPIRVGGRVAGVLCNEYIGDGFRHWILEDQNFAGALADVVARAIQAHKRKQADTEHERLQQEVIDAQRVALKELSTPIIPLMDRIIVMPLVGSIDSMRARDLMRALLEGISQHRAKIVILDVTGVSMMDTGIVNHLNKTIQAARLKGAQTIVTGISDAVAESIVDLGIDWGAVETLRDLQTGLRVALARMGGDYGRAG